MAETTNAVETARTLGTEHGKRDAEAWWASSAPEHSWRDFGRGPVQCCVVCRAEMRCPHDRKILQSQGDGQWYCPECGDEWHEDAWGRCAPRSLPEPDLTGADATALDHVLSGEMSTDACATYESAYRAAVENTISVQPASESLDLAIPWGGLVWRFHGGKEPRCRIPRSPTLPT